MRKIFSIGGNGLVGSRVKELLRGSYSFTTVSSSTGVDITDPSTLELLKNDTEHEVVLLFAAKTDVDGCELDKSLGEDGEAWKINVTGVRNVVDACRKGNKKLVYISTDFVFDGENTPEEGYTEDDTPNPVNWYGQTKYEGEKVVQNAGIPFLILRLAYPYRAEFEKKMDFVRAILGRLKDGKPVKGVTDHLFTPTFIDDFVEALTVLLEKDIRGIYHVTGSQFLTPYEASLGIAKTFGVDEALISKTTRSEYFAGKAPRPFNLSMNNARIKQLGASMHSFEEGLLEIKQQMVSKKI